MIYVKLCVVKVLTDTNCSVIFVWSCSSQHSALVKCGACVALT